MKVINRLSEDVANAVSKAFSHVDVTDYTPSRHALERARIRYGIVHEKATEWLNDIMKKATFEAVNDKGQARYFYDGMTVITDDVAQTIITVYSNGEADFLKPVLEREKRKLKRQYTPIIRSLELQYAKALRDIADMAVNRAKARSPKVRAIITGNIAEKQREIDEFLTKIERTTDEWRSKERVIEVIAE